LLLRKAESTREEDKDEEQAQQPEHDGSVVGHRTPRSCERNNEGEPWFVELTGGLNRAELSGAELS
jgi:hypothetical protein